jgi:hypothetical protein
MGWGDAEDVIWDAVERDWSFRASRFTPAFGRAVASCGHCVLLARVNACPSGFSAPMEIGGSGRAYARCPHLRIETWGTRLVVGDDLAGLGDVLFDGFDPVGPVASGFIGVGNASGVLTLGLG